MDTEDFRQRYFIAARDLYHGAREVEWRILRNKLKELLKKAGYEVQSRGNSGHGVNNLTNWRWITIQKNKQDALIISLQAPDCDGKSENHHVLEDRIALIDPGSDGFGLSGNVTAEITDFTLPLSDKDADDLVSLILEKLKKSDGSLS